MTLPVFESIADALIPNHSALVVVDMQNAYGTADAVRGDLKKLALFNASIPAQAALIQKAHEAGVLVVYIKNTVVGDYLSDSPPYLAQKERARAAHLISLAKDRQPDPVQDESWGNDVVDPLRRLTPELIVVKKNRASAFVNTNLPLILRSNGIKTVVVTGYATDGCVAATARDALTNDYVCIVARDAVGSYNKERHDAALKVFASLFDVVPSSAVLSVWEEFKR